MFYIVTVHLMSYTSPTAPRAAKTEQPLLPKEEVPEGTDESREQMTTNSVEQSEGKLIK